MGKKVWIGVGLVVLVFVAWFFLGNLENNRKGDYLENYREELNITEEGPGWAVVEGYGNLSTEEGFQHEYLFDEGRRIDVNCEKCDRASECRFTCFESCLDKGFTDSTLLSLESWGECHCKCNPAIHVNDIFTARAVLEKSLDECNIIEIKTKSGNRNNCYSLVSIFTQNDSICEKIYLDDPLKNNCYSNLAIMKQERSICSKIVEVMGSSWTREICEEYISEGKEFWYSVPA